MSLEACTLPGNKTAISLPGVFEGVVHTLGIVNYCAVVIGVTCQVKRINYKIRNIVVLKLISAIICGPPGRGRIVQGVVKKEIIAKLQKLHVMTPTRLIDKLFQNLVKHFKIAFVLSGIFKIHDSRNIGLKMWERPHLTVNHSVAVGNKGVFFVGTQCLPYRGKFFNNFFSLLFFFLFFDAFKKSNELHKKSIIIRRKLRCTLSE
ncbi:MAG: hypothetical protein BWY70_00646 [Bacteroidetes bacterium ADurb.Bin408]|nr:MAG: hypothetical protein BWY70_00646 [Bacteroidetes bacterium ADurb.Bin408]